MPPKKRDKETETTKNPRMDQIQADHELFLQAFEKPTQIYRFLRTRNMLSPVFLNRTLSYMQQRMSRTHKHRQGFRVDCLMERMVKKKKELQPDTMGGYMTLTFLGFYDDRIDTHQDPVKVETVLLKICHKKRKDVSSQFMQVSVGTSEVPINPSEDHPPPKAPTVSIPTESFTLSNGHLVKSYVLLLKVACTSTGSLATNSDADIEPAHKRRKSSAPQKCQVDEVKFYGSELVVYDKHNRCLLTDGDYDLLLQEVQTNVRGSPKKHSSWETIDDVKDDSGQFEVLSKGPTLKFHLSWTTEPSSGLVDRPKPLGATDLLDSSSNKENRPAERVQQKPNKPEEPRLQIVYQFLYNNNSRQQTEACEDLTCPWCSLDCVSLYALLKHLKLCHSRFTFTYVPIPQGARIDVAINECYDGSYTGSPHDLISQPPGFAFSRNGPVRRTSVSNILVCRPKRPKPSLSEFLEIDENEYDGQRPYITGHNRLYHHTTTCLPIYPKEMDVDSEGEHDPKWLQTKTMMMIDDFTDVNEGEKELMKMWNLHVMKHGYVGDCQIPLACTMFLESKGKELLQKNLYRNFVLHVCSLFDFGLLSPVTLYNIIQKLQDLVPQNGEVRDILQGSWRRQRNSWGLSPGQTSANTTSDRVPQSPSEMILRRKAACQNINGDGKTCMVSSNEHPPRRKPTVVSEHHHGESQFNDDFQQGFMRERDSVHSSQSPRELQERSDSVHEQPLHQVQGQLQEQLHSVDSRQILQLQLFQSQSSQAMETHRDQHSHQQHHLTQQQGQQHQELCRLQTGSHVGDASQVLHRRKSMNSQQASSHGNSNSGKGLMLNGGGTSGVPEAGLATSQRRKSATSVLAASSISSSAVGAMNGNENITSQPRRKSLGHSQSNSESLPPLRRKSFNQQSADINSGKGASENRQPLTNSLLTDSSTIQHRRKSSSALSDANSSHVHSTKSSGS